MLTFETLVFQELFENLEKQRPNLFRLASDTDENDNDGISMIVVSGFQKLLLTYFSCNEMFYYL